MRRVSFAPIARCLSIAAAALNAAHAQDTTKVLTPVTVSAHRAPTTVGGAVALTAQLDSLPTPPAPTLDVALRRLPFVFVRANSRGETELSIRGSESRSPTVLLDGLPVTLGWDSRTDPSLIPLSGASTLRVSRGMGSVLAGPNAVGGVIEIDAARAAISERSIGLSTGVDHLGGSVIAGHFASPVSNRFGFRVGGATRDQSALVRADDVVDPGAPDGERLNSDAKEFDLFTHLRYGAAGGAYVSGGVSGYKAERGVQPETHIPDPRRWRYPSQSRTFVTLATGTGVRNGPFGVMSIDASFGVNAGKTEIESYTDNTYTTIDGREFGDERTFVSRIVATQALGRATMRLGGTMSSVRYVERFDTDPSTRFTQRLMNVGVEADVPASSVVSFSAGIGIDKAENPETGGRPPLAARDDWAGRFGVTANFGAVRLHGAASQRSRFPALRELYSGSLGRFEPNPDLRPERLTTIEVGATVTRGALQVQGALFRQVNEDGVIRITLPNNNFQRVNRDEIRSTGFEAVGVWSRGGVSLIGDLLAQKVRVHDIPAGSAEARAENVPQLRATLGAVAPMFAKINANAWLSHSGTQYCESGAIEVEGKTRVDFGVDRAWSMARGILRELRASVAVDNVADAAVYDACGLPQPGRTLRAGLSLR